jgi:hypothetical protein
VDDNLDWPAFVVCLALCLGVLLVKKVQYWRTCVTLIVVMMLALQLARSFRVQKARSALRNPNPTQVEVTK